MKKIILLLFCINLYAINYASVFFVTNNNDSGTGSLRDAIDLANLDGSSSSVIPHIIDMSSVHDTVTLLSPLSVISNHMVLYGPQIGNPFVINGDNQYSVFTTYPGAYYFELNSITIINANNQGISGAALYVDFNMTVKVRKCNFYYCVSGIDGGAIYNDGNLSIENCTFAYDSAVSTGSCITNNSYLYAKKITASNNYSNGGSICNFAVAVIDSSTFYDNYSPFAGAGVYSTGGITKTMNTTFLNNGAGYVGAYYNGLSAIDTILNCTFDKNYNVAGSGNVLADYSSMYIENCTFSKNVSGLEGGALYVNDTNTHVKNCTFWGNYSQASGGGAILIDPGMKLNIENSIIIGNSAAANFANDISGEITGGGHNIIGDTVGTILTSSPNSFYNISAIAVLDTNLMDNGGATKTHAIVVCGNAVNNANNNAPVYDQAGMARYGAPDIGAFEAQKVVNFSVNAANDTLCSYASAITLTATPSGGTYSGNGISGNTFTPSVSILGMNVITYTYVDSNNCTSIGTDSIYVDVCTGIASNESVLLNVYPNPSSGLFFIETEAIANANIIVRDVLGKIIVQQKITQNKFAIDLSKYENGIYFIEIGSDNERTVKHIIIQK